jgi:DNA-binding CsgD family transcriptional regulator
MFFFFPKKQQKKKATSIRLTPRQKDCLQYTADGHTARSIAHRLGISERMVRFHLEGARQRLNAGSTTQAVHLATKLGLID